MTAAGSLWSPEYRDLILVVYISTWSGGSLMGGNAIHGWPLSIIYAAKLIFFSSQVQVPFTRQFNFEVTKGIIQKKQVG